MKLLKDNNRDEIIAFLKDPEGKHSLSEKQQQLLVYYVDAYTLHRNYNSIPDTITILVKLSQRRGEPISQATARRYIYEAMDVFGMASEMKREAIRHLSSEIIMDAIAMAREQGDPKTMINGAKELAALNGSNDPEAPNFDLLEAHLYEIIGDQQALKTLQQLTTKGVVDLDALTGNVMNSMAEDAKTEQ